ncbi:hypothetical protein D3C78_1257670 [compost metagenome]
MIVSVISSSVKESRAEVASSKINKRGFRISALAIDNRCFSPPDSFIPDSPNLVFKPFSERLSIGRQAAFSSALIISSSVASGLAKSKFSLIVPANS